MDANDITDGGGTTEAPYARLISLKNTQQPLREDSGAFMGVSPLGPSSRQQVALSSQFSASCYSKQKKKKKEEGWIQPQLPEAIENFMRIF